MNFSKVASLILFAEFSSELNRSERLLNERVWFIKLQVFINKWMDIVI